MGRVIVTVAVTTFVVLVGFYELFGYLGSGVFQKSDVPLWLRSVKTTAGIFQATATGLTFIVGGLFAYYRFFKEETYSPRLQPSISTAVWYSANRFYVQVTATVENSGQISVYLHKERTYHIASTRMPGDSGWTDYGVNRIFAEQLFVQPSEIMSDQIWFEVPDNGEVALQTEFVVATVVDSNERGVVGLGWRARDIVSLLDIRSSITDTSESDVERG
jgi:hypothetical protein